MEDSQPQPSLENSGRRRRNDPATRPPPSESTASGESHKPRSRRTRPKDKGKGKEIAPEEGGDSDATNNISSAPELGENIERLRAAALQEQWETHLPPPRAAAINDKVYERMLQTKPPTPEGKMGDYNNWGDVYIGDPGMAPLPSDDDARSTASARRRTRNRNRNLPRGSHVLGQKPQGIVPNQRPKKATMPPKREFGAQLTSAAPAAPAAATSSRATPGADRESTSKAPNSNADSDGNLRADAPAFVPPHLRAAVEAGALPVYPPDWGPSSSKSSTGRKATPPTQPSGVPAHPFRKQQAQHQPRNREPKREPKPRIKGFAKVEEGNGSDDITSRIHREVANGSYECMVCYGGVHRNSKIWECRCCWGIYHLNCIQKWARQGLDVAPSGPVGADPPPRTWRCPSCNNPEEEVPAQYSCWCEKTVQPEISKMLPPHSCGQSCGKARSSPKNCPHPCDLQCHAGPCPPCTSLGPTKLCFCGKEETQRRCVDTDYENGWSCKQTCGDFMPCGEHSCPKPCHPLLCGACEVPELLSCFCGEEVSEVKCCDKQEAKHSLKLTEDDDIKSWDGYYRCGKTCNRLFDCSVHSCTKPCHSQDASPAHCPLSPDVITKCACGKTEINDILDKPRSSCEEPIPTCDKVCNKSLACGHPCLKKCHDGDCGGCFVDINVVCRCGKTISKSLCHQGVESEPPQCMRQCRAALNCGRHECGEKCCSGEQKANERLAAKKKSKSQNRPAIPGLQTDDGFEPEHICTRTCGKLLKCGKHTCPMLCHRGACGTCLNASFDDLSCNCGRTIIRAPVPCGSQPPPCSHPCARSKACGHPGVPHECHLDDVNCPPCPYLVEKSCKCGKKRVKAVQCWREGVSCGTECGQKLSCGTHLCRKTCHTAADCCEEPCKQECGKMKTACGHKCHDPCHAPFPCLETKPCPEKLTLSCDCGGIKQEVRCGATKGNPAGNNTEIKCSDACRARRLALALELDPEREGTTPYSDETLALYKKDRLRHGELEASIRKFVQTATARDTRFQPMGKSRRHFIHLLANDLGLDSESRDPEPYRSVFLFKPVKYAGLAPRKTIAEHLASAPTAEPAVVAPPPPAAVQQLRKPRPAQQFNALLLSKIRIGLLASELERELGPCLRDSRLRFDIAWTGDEDVLLTPRPSSLVPAQLETELQALCPRLRSWVNSHQLADKVELCAASPDGKVAARETESWSLVANKRAAPALAGPTGFTSENGFAGLADGAQVVKKKSVEVRKPKPEEVVDDWEMEAGEESD